MTDFDSLREDIHKLAVSFTDYALTGARQAVAFEDEVRKLWADNAELRDELHALANRVEALTRAVTTEPAEVAEMLTSNELRRRRQLEEWGK